MKDKSEKSKDTVYRICIVIKRAHLTKLFVAVSLTSLVVTEYADYFIRVYLVAHNMGEYIAAALVST